MYLTCFLSLIFLLSCATKPRTDDTINYVLKADHSEYMFSSLLQSDGTLLVTSSIAQETTPLILKVSELDPKVFEGDKDSTGKYWHHIKFPDIMFTKYYLAPYYGMFGYRAITQAKDFENGLFDPECPLMTKYLVLMYINHQHLPIFGCIL